MDNPLLIWAIVCLLGALVLFFLEVFLPSGGILGGLASVSLIASIVLFFGINHTLGLFMSIVSLAALPFMIGLAIKVWPSTPIARLLTLRDPNEDAQQYGEADPTNPTALKTNDQNEREALIGTQGVALTDLHPGGSCRFEKKKYDCIASGGYIEKDTPVEAIGWSGPQVRVRPCR